MKTSMKKKNIVLLMLMLVTILPIATTMTAMAHEPSPGWDDRKIFIGRVNDYRGGAKFILFNATERCVFMSFNPFVRQHYHEGDSVTVEIQSICFRLNPPLTRDFVFIIAYQLSAPWGIN